MQHVGTLRKYRLYWAIYKALKSVGEPHDGKGQIFREKEQHEEKCINHYQIDNIVYNQQPHPKYANDANIKVSVRWSEIREKDHLGLRHEVVSITISSTRHREP